MLCSVFAPPASLTACVKLLVFLLVILSSIFSSRATALKGGLALARARGSALAITSKRVFQVGNAISHRRPVIVCICLQSAPHQDQEQMWRFMPGCCTAKKNPRWANATVLHVLGLEPFYAPLDQAPHVYTMVGIQLQRWWYCKYTCLQLHLPTGILSFISFFTMIVLLAGKV